MKHLIKQNRGFVIFMLCFGFFRLAIADWNPIPSSSMRPTLLEGDVVLVDRLAYDFKIPLTDISVMSLGEPKRGDVITFTSPADGRRLIKRLVGLPGDVLEMRNEVLYVNGAAAEYSALQHVTEILDKDQAVDAIRATEEVAGSKHTVQILPPIAAKRSFGPVTVPAGSYFFLGDNRDNSADSRYIGFVSRHLLVGRAHHILVSADIIGNWSPRVGRFGERIH